ncbi:MAG: LysM peptidoglycan-binding domain-containing protein [Candidatus Goldiibacteriota bacterium]
MRKFLAVIFAGLFMFGALFMSGCGGGQKINAVTDEEEEVMREASEKKAEGFSGTYIVEPGDTLWSIAAKPEIYGNKYQWPLIYDANRDILDTYEQIEDGQKLIIPRNISAVEIAAAKERSEELGIPPAETAGVSEPSYEDDYYESDYGGEDGVSVAGLDSDDADAMESSARLEEETEGDRDEFSDSRYEEEEDFEYMPTPIPEPRKVQKEDGGSKLPVILIVVLLAGAAAAGYVFMRKKKKEDEEDENDSDDSGILT